MSTISKHAEKILTKKLGHHSMISFHSWKFWYCQDCDYDKKKEEESQ